MTRNNSGKYELYLIYLSLSIICSPSQKPCELLTSLGVRRPPQKQQLCKKPLDCVCPSSSSETCSSKEKRIKGAAALEKKALISKIAAKKINCTLLHLFSEFDVHSLNCSFFRLSQGSQGARGDFDASWPQRLERYQQSPT